MATSSSSSSSSSLVLHPLPSQDVEAAYQIEAESYPQAEAATLEGMRYRQKHAGPYFYGLYKGEELIGFVNGTCSTGRELTHETMSHHEEQGETLCLHSVVIRAPFRRNGFAKAMLTEYIGKVFACNPHLYRMLLLSKAHLIHFYQSCGFHFLHVSPVEHGQDTWFELGLDRVSVIRHRPYYQVDAFTSQAFAGNPAAVVISEPGDEEEWMQSWAMENNLSETAFLQELPSQGDDSPARFKLRWFTPTVEVDLCGHATLASAHVLWATRRVRPAQAIDFLTKSGVHTAIMTTPAEGDSSLIELNFPIEAAKEIPNARTSTEYQTVKAALKCSDDDILYVGRSRLDVLVEVTPQAFQHHDPDVSVLAGIECRGIIVTSKATGGAAAGGRAPASCDFVSRFFGPR